MASCLSLEIKYGEEAVPLPLRAAMATGVENNDIIRTTIALKTSHAYPLRKVGTGQEGTVFHLLSAAKSPLTGEGALERAGYQLLFSSVMPSMRRAK